MKKIILAAVFALSSYAQIPVGNYELQKIKCYNSNAELKLGGKFMIYKINLDVTETNMRMTAIAKNGSWAPFRLRCTQTNFGSFDVTSNSQYEGSLPLESVKCNAKAWESILKKQLFGVEEQGTFDYIVNNDELIISNPNTITRYKSCEEVNSYPVYYYKKK